MMRVLYDGWPLVRRPNSPAAQHLRTLLAYRPESVEAFVALPGFLTERLPKDAQPRVVETAEGERAHLGWEQRRLSQLAAELRAQIVHLTSPRPALFGRALSVISPSGFGPLHSLGRREAGVPEGAASRTLAGRLREAMAQGGLARGSVLLWPADLPAPETRLAFVKLPPVVHPAFSGAAAAPEPSSNGDQRAESHPSLASLEVEIPEAYILYHGPTDLPALRRLLTAWSWAAGPIGAYYPLLVVGVEAETRAAFENLALTAGLSETVRALPVLPPELLPGLYEGCSAVFHPAEVSPWGGPLRPALAYAKPVVARESVWAGALAGPAAYLAPEEPSGRALGAALITVIVEESVAEKIVQAARKRAAAWSGEEFRRELGAAYRSLLDQR